MQSYSLKTTVPFVVLFLGSVIGTPIYLYYRDLTWVAGAMFLLMTVLTLMSITAGYHRLFSHKSYQANSLVKFLFLFFGAGAFQESCLKWSAEHRIHHRYVDTEKDPYNIHQGFFWAHMGWMISGKDPKAPHPKDLVSDPLVMWQHNHWFWIGLVSGFLFPMVLGYALGDMWGGLFFGGFVRLFVGHHCTFFVNSIAHTFGTQPYSDETTARDSWWVALLTFGEGYHNFHHKYPADYRNGIRAYHWDPSKWLIQILHVVGMTWNLKQTPEEVIMRNKVKTQFHGLELTKFKELDALRQQLYAEMMERLDEFSHSKKAWIEAKKSMAAEKIEQAEKDFEVEIHKLKDKIEHTRQSYQQSYEAWCLFLQYAQKHLAS
ncbi:MAG: fatty acid desaturase [Bdellovibrionota bacterium]